jgi:hypothetical protein
VVNSLLEMLMYDSIEVHKLNIRAEEAMITTAKNAISVWDRCREKRGQMEPADLEGMWGQERGEEHETK